MKIIRKRKLFSILLTIFLVFLILAGAGILYLNQVVLPTKGKALVIESLKKATARRIALERLSYNPFQGLVLRGLVIGEDEKFGKDAFLKVDELSFNLLILPFIKERKIIISSLALDSPEINIFNDTSGQWNFSGLFPKGKEETKTKMTFLIQKARISDGIISFTDNTKNGFTKRLSRLNGQASFKLPQSVQFEAATLTSGQPEAWVRLAGRYNLGNEELSLKINTGKFSPREYMPYYANLLPLDINKGLASLDATAELNAAKDLALHGNSKLYGFESEYQNPFKEWGEKIYFSGNLDLEGKLNFNIKNFTGVQYDIASTLAAVSIKGLPFIDDLSQLAGKINFTPEGISIFRLKGLTRNSPVAISGSFKNPKEPTYELAVASQFDLANYINYVAPGTRPKFEEIKANGILDFDIQIKDRLKDTAPPVIWGRAKLVSASVKTPALEEAVENINGELTIKKSELAVYDITAYYKTFPYALHGKLKDFSKPSIHMDLTSQNISMVGDFDIAGKNIRASNVRGKLFNSPYELEGDLVDLNNPSVDAQVKLDLNLIDLRQILPRMAQVFSGLKLEGITHLELRGQGQLKDRQSWNAGLNGKGPIIKILGLNFEDAFLEGTIQNGKLFVPRLMARAYRGYLASGFAMDLAPFDMPYHIETALQDIDIAELKKDTEFKDKDISGLFTSKFALDGMSNDIGTLTGGGWLSVDNGKLWELPTFWALAEILGLPSLKKIVFTQMNGNFSVSNKHVATDDLQLLSEDARLLARGHVDFDGNLNFAVITQFAPHIIERTGILGPLSNLIMNEEGQLVGEFRLRGTIKKPKYTYVPIQIEKFLKKRAVDLLKKLF